MPSSNGPSLDPFRTPAVPETQLAKSDDIAHDLRRRLAEAGLEAVRDEDGVLLGWGPGERHLCAASRREVGEYIQARLEWRRSPWWLRLLAYTPFVDLWRTRETITSLDKTLARRAKARLHDAEHEAILRDVSGDGRA